MSSDEAKKNAVQFLKDQAAIISKYGKPPKLSGEDYRSARDDAAKTFRALSSNKPAD